MKQFLSVDWGTTTLRLRLVDPVSKKAVSSVSLDRGIALVYAAWSEACLSEQVRPSFFHAVLLEAIAELGTSCAGCGMVISGMASSNIGMYPLPYKELPFLADGSDLLTSYFEATEAFPYPTLLISGVRSQEDVMRGEETQLAGCVIDSSSLLIFPGTHSKHIYVEGTKVVRFKTFMTGEFFSILSKHSILADSIAFGNRSEDHQAEAFKEGVAESLKGQLMHLAFRVRTNQLFNRFVPWENRHFLSGLLIGTELRELVDTDSPITVVGDEAQRLRYLSAFDTLGIRNVKTQDSEAAVIAGHCRIVSAFTKGFR